MKNFSVILGIDPVLCFHFHPRVFVPMLQGELFSGEGYVRPDPFIVRNCGTYATEQFELPINRLIGRGGTGTACRACARCME